MRKQMYGTLEALLGPAVRSREGCDWWEIRRDGRRAVHICLNSPSESVAHVLFFDTDPSTLEPIVDVSARTPPEAEAITARVKAFMADGHDKPPPQSKG